MGIFLGENYEVERSVESEFFNIEELLNGISIQTPKKGATRNDVVLELSNQQLAVYKRSDIRQTEISNVPVAALAQQPWTAIVVDHTYLTDCIEAIEKYHKQEERRTAYLEQGFTFGGEEDLFEDAAEQSTAGQQGENRVVLTQAVATRSDTNLLYVEPPNNSDGYECSAVVIVNTKEATEDYNEAD
jgi:hypothetical protein